jgi:hypothetical protein
VKESGLCLHATFTGEEAEFSKKGTCAKNGDISKLIDIDFVGTMGNIRYAHQTCRTIEIIPRTREAARPLPAGS